MPPIMSGLWLISVFIVVLILTKDILWNKANANAYALALS
jgi:hypothetical protein